MVTHTDESEHHIMTQFDDDSRYRSKAELVRVLHDVGVPEETIVQIAAKLSDPVDLDKSGALLQSYGLTRDALISRMGGSP
jgi:hypothetical protein